MDFPIVLVFSNSKTVSITDIVSSKYWFNYKILVVSLKFSLLDIRKVSIEEKQKQFSDLTGYLHPISTKYYNTEIVLLPAEEISDVPANIKENIEGILIYFDADDVSFIDFLIALDLGS